MIWDIHSETFPICSPRAFVTHSFGKITQVNWCKPGINFIFGMIHPKALGKMAQSTCHIARALHSEVISSIILLNIGNIRSCWVHVLGSTSKGHANVVMEGEGFLQKCPLCTHSNLTSMCGNYCLADLEWQKHLDAEGHVHGDLCRTDPTI